MSGPEEIFHIPSTEEFKYVILPSIHIITTIEKVLDAGVNWNSIILGSNWQMELDLKPFNAYDMILGYARNDELPGFSVYGNTGYKVVVLGNSTSDSRGNNITSWPVFFQRELKKKGIETVLYNGACVAYDSKHELYKLLRDVIPMNPDLVISFSGINDTYYFQKRQVCEHNPGIMKHQEDFLCYAMKCAKKDQYFPEISQRSIQQYSLGITYSVTPEEQWINNERAMHALCAEFNIPFLAFLQPCRDIGGYIKSGEPEKKSFARDREKNIQLLQDGYSSLKTLIREYDYIFDMTGLFEGKRNIYYDYVHVFQKGNEEIAHFISDIVINNINWFSEKSCCLKAVKSLE